MSDELKPALTPEEWKAALDNVFMLQAMALEAVSPERGNSVRNIALAKASLPEDSPYKITRADVLTLRRIAEANIEGDASEDYYLHGTVSTSEIGDVAAIAAKLNALLPSEQ